MIEIVTLTAADTHDLRRRVLRDGAPDAVVVWDGDDEPTTFHLGARVDGELVAVSTWMRRDRHDRPGDRAVQLRGMAADPEHRGTGVARQLLLAGVERCADEGADLVWARARSRALSFYLRHGFDAVGPEYVDATTGLPHRDIVRVV